MATPIFREGFIAPLEKEEYCVVDPNRLSYLKAKIYSPPIPIFNLNFVPPESPARQPIPQSKIIKHTEIFMLFLIFF
jgi:hypothetical protein